jgi:hypothetical protein
MGPEVSMGMGMQPEPELEMKILGVLLRHDYVPSSVTHRKLASDITRYGKEVLKLAYTMSPSQLGKMGLLGIRRLSQLKRDDPEKFKKVMADLEVILK